MLWVYGVQTAGIQSFYLNISKGKLIVWGYSIIEGNNICCGPTMHGNMSFVLSWVTHTVCILLAAITFFLFYFYISQKAQNLNPQSSSSGHLNFLVLENITFFPKGRALLHIFLTSWVLTQPVSSLGDQWVCSCVSTTANTSGSSQRPNVRVVKRRLFLWTCWTKICCLPLQSPYCGEHPSIWCTGIRKHPRNKMVIFTAWFLLSCSSFFCLTSILCALPRQPPGVFPSGRTHLQLRFTCKAHVLTATVEKV